MSIGGVALAVMLTLLLNGLLTGMYVQISSYLENTPGSIVVAQDGVNNLLAATSLLPGGAAASVKSQGADVIVAQQDACNMHMTSSALPHAHELLHLVK